MSVSNSLGYQGFAIPVGSVLPYAGQITPNGWLICDGGLYPVEEYSSLFSVIGNTYGSSFSGAVLQTGNTLTCINFDGTVTQAGTTLTIVSSVVGQEIIPSMEIAITGFGNVVIVGEITPTTFLVNISQTIATPTVGISADPATAQGGFFVGQEIILSSGFLPVTVTAVAGGVATVTPSQTTPVVLAQSNDFRTPDLVGKYIEGANAVNPVVQPPTFSAGGSFTLATGNIPNFSPTLTGSTATASIQGNGSNGLPIQQGTPSGVAPTSRLVMDNSAFTSTFTTVLNAPATSTYALGRVPPLVSAPLTSAGFTLNSLELVYIIKGTWN